MDRALSVGVIGASIDAMPSRALEAFLGQPSEERRLGRFRLIEPLGKGGFAPVWRAIETYDDQELREVAVKLFAVGDAAFGPTSADARTQAIVEEASALCRVEHANIVRFYTFSKDATATVFGLVMEYVRGAPLDRRLERGPLAVSDAIQVGVAIAAALAAVHKVGLVHRDIKPANVVETEGIYKVIDFGIAAAERRARAPREKPRVLDDLPLETLHSRASVIGDGASGSGDAASISGTVGYIDPVCLAMSSPATPASDLYALGATLYECLTGAVPALAKAKRDGSAGLAGSVLDGRERAIPVATLEPRVPTELARMVDALVEPTREARPASAAHVEEKLRALAGDRARGAGRSRRTIAVVAAVIAAGGATAVGWSVRAARLRATCVAPLASVVGASQVDACERTCGASTPTECTVLATLAERGLGTTRDHKRAATLYRRACAEGGMRACAGLARLSYLGRGLARDVAGARSLYERACAAGEQRGCVGLGELYYRGNGVAIDAARAAGLFRAACDAGEPSGCTGLAWTYHDGKGNDLDRSKAVALVERSCENRDPVGCNSLGYFLAHGEGVARDPARAVTLFEQSCSDGDTQACANVGGMYQKGDGVPKDELKAVALYKQACDGENAFGCNNLGLAYRDGRAVQKSEEEAARFFRLACDGLDYRGCINLGELHRRGLGVERNVAIALELFKRACDADFVSGCVHQGQLLLEGSRDERATAREPLEKACALHDDEACKLLGR
jgi:TPR repeat protein/serine/threonine protein kinase